MRKEEWLETLKGKTVKGLLELLKDVRINSMSKTPEEIRMLIEEISKRHLWEADKIEFEYLRDMPVEPKVEVEVEKETERKVPGSIYEHLGASTYSKSDFDSNKYPALKTAIGIINIIGWIVLVVSFLGFIAALSLTRNLWIGLAVLFSGFLVFLLLLAYGNMLQIMVDMEYNIRKMSNEMCRNSSKTRTQ